MDHFWCRCDGQSPRVLSGTRSAGEEDPLAQEIHSGPAEHLPFEHLDPVHLTFHRAGTERQQQPRRRTVDGMSLGKVEHVIDALRHERYRWSPARRVYIPKGRGSTKLRPLGLPPWSDELVGEVIRHDRTTGRRGQIAWPPDIAKPLWFAEMMRDRVGHHLAKWLDEADATDLPELRSFVDHRDPRPVGERDQGVRVVPRGAVHPRDIVRLRTGRERQGWGTSPGL
jgi:hypothetical protein